MHLDCGYILGPTNDIWIYMYILIFVYFPETKMMKRGAEVKIRQ